jgi:hypothetical protein
MSEPISSTVPADPRKQKIGDMRKMLAWLAKHPEVPLPSFEVEHCILSDDDDDGLGWISTIASDLDVEPTTNPDGTHHYATRRFGTASYRAFYVTSQRMKNFAAGQRHLRECAALQELPVVDGAVVDEQRALAGAVSE